MSEIQLLSQDTIDKIAAGEVVERPSSVVKELVENAIDAGAASVTVEIKDGGISLIRVTDNGCGIPEEEVRAAFRRHATSKIRTVEDLSTSGTLGFRGEALSSIAAVAQVEMITKAPDALLGVRYVIEGGKEQTFEEIGAPDGTTIFARNLFYHTPARRKFLKSAATEGGYISDLIDRLALSHPDISFRFINNRDERLHTSGNGRMRDIIYNVYGREITSNLVEMDVTDEAVSIGGLIGKPVISRGNRHYETYFVNGRYVKNTVISRAIEDAYKPYLMNHQFPFTVLTIDVDPSLVDVNVHPTKMEVRFADQNLIYDEVTQAVKDALVQRELIPEVTFGREEKKAEERQPAEKRPEEKPTGEKQTEEKQPEKKQTEKERNAGRAPEPFEKVRRQVYRETVRDSLPDRIGEPGPEQMELFEEDKLLNTENIKKHKLIGQVFDTYWIVEFEDKMYIIDQHAAHEKVLYERFMKQLREKRQTSQMITPPLIVSLSAQEEDLLNRHRDSFAEVGFEIEPFGGREYAVSAVPANLYGIADEALFHDLLDGLTDLGGRTQQDTVCEKLASMSCKAAVKGNHSFSAAEAEALIGELLTLDNPYNCPHGRPTIISMSKYELEKKFKRIV